jgi:hypothetical protein
LSVLGYYLLYVWFGSLYCIFEFLTRGVFVVILYSFVGSIVNLSNWCYLDSTRITCIFRHARGAWWCVSKATPCRLWWKCYHPQGADFGALQVVSEPWFCRYPRVQSACRLILPTDELSLVSKLFLLKMRWIVLSSSAFFSLPSLLLCSYLCEFCVLFLAYLFEFGFLRGWTISCLCPNRSDHREFIIVIVSNHPLLVVSRKSFC